MFSINNISIDLKSQDFFLDSFKYEYDDNGKPKSIFKLVSKRATSGFKCPNCGKPVDIYQTYTITLKDMPLFYDMYQEVKVSYHRYRCNDCGKTFTENIDEFKYPGTRITNRAAQWIKGLLKYNMTISAVHSLTGIHWNTIKKIHMEIMNDALAIRADELKKQDYKPKHLAVDEFAIHKGHRYATCVLDLDTGDVLWVGKGRAKADFKKFFEEIDMEYISEVKAIAMDMNASYNLVVSEYMPKVEIVYDRFHMQAQYGRDVLGVVRLDAARNHQKTAKQYKEQIKEIDESETKRDLKAKAKIESELYSKLKKSRWSLLMNQSNLSEDKLENLNEILTDHQDLAICYAMKEEMCELFKITDETEAAIRWTKWFEAAESSNIPALVKFANLKKERINGLIAHAKYHISTGKLEGLNNKIKVAKRIAYGYRDHEYFFTLIKYMSIPWVKLHR